MYINQSSIKQFIVLQQYAELHNLKI